MRYPILQILSFYLIGIITLQHISPSFMLVVQTIPPINTSNPSAPKPKTIFYVAPLFLSDSKLSPFHSLVPLGYYWNIFFINFFLIWQGYPIFLSIPKCIWIFCIDCVFKNFLNFVLCLLPFCTKKPGFYFFMRKVILDKFKILMFYFNGSITFIGLMNLCRYFWNKFKFKECLVSLPIVNQIPFLLVFLFLPVVCG